jgi:hypothetical protein
MTAFFIPELGLEGASAEHAYAGIRRAAQAHTGYEPQARRIFKLWCRRDGVDCEAEVGKPDPVTGQMVLAILDLGRHGPYLIDFGSPTGARTQLMVPKPVYEVTEFTTRGAG